MEKKLTRSVSNRMIAGICGGLAYYLEVDATIIRLGYVFLTLFTAAFPGVLCYIIAYFIIPKETNV